MSKFWLIVFILLGLFVATVIYKKKTAVPRCGKKMENVLLIDEPTGIKYELIKAPAADAKSVEKGDTAVVHYTGWLSNNGKRGAEFDSSHSRNKPFEFNVGLGYVIKGWDEMVSRMKEGERRIVHIPAALGYGARNVGPIPANSDLIFDIELIKVKK